jgi:hypothetical protein
MAFDRDHFAAELRRELQPKPQTVAPVLKAPALTAPPVRVEVVAAPARSWRLIPMRDGDGLIQEVLLEPV